jgi:hypothetical protein
MKNSLLLTIGLASLLAFQAQASQEKLATSIRNVQVETTRTAEQLKATLAALNALSQQTKGDLRPAYEAFSTEVGKTQAAAQTTRKRVSWMSGEGLSYFTDWEATINDIANENLRKKALKRLTAVRGSFDKIEAALKNASDKFTPFLSDLSDIQKTLATDVTVGGLKAVRGTVKSANWDHQFVAKAINSALKDLSKMEKALSSEAT